MGSRSNSAKITGTRNYSLFHFNKQNREVSLKGRKRRKLVESMKEYGFLRGYPIVCIRNGAGLTILDGQHRLAAAQELGIPVFYMVVDSPYDIADVNDTQRGWTTKDYAMKWANCGKHAYVELMSFAEEHSISIALAAMLLGNSFGNAGTFRTAFNKGRWEVVDRRSAETTLLIYNAITLLKPELKTRFLIYAVQASLLVKGLDVDRLIKGIHRHPEGLMKYGSRDGYLAMLEECYNYGRSKKAALKIEAQNALNRRNPARRNITAG